MVLRADQELTPGHYPFWARDLLTLQCGRSLIASSEGVNYVALLGLQFYRGGWQP
jgi:hypothetical protein